MTHTVHLPLILNQEPRLKDLFGRFGIRFGFCVGSGSFAYAVTRELIRWHADIVTTESELNMKFVQPKQGIFYWDRVDQIVASAHALGIDVHGIPASWAFPLNPDWLVTGSFSAGQLATILKEHVSTLAKHFDFISLDTCNEAYITGFDPVYGGVWQPLGEDYVRISFESARGYGYPVLYNSFFPEPADAEYDKALELVGSGLADAIGIQLHLWDGSYQQTLERTDAFLSCIRAVGGWCRFSEIGVLAGSNWAQSIVYAEITALAIKYKDIVKDYVVWGVKDPAWRGNTTLFDRDGKPKLAYYAVVEELRK